MKKVMNQDNEVLNLYNDIQEATSILVHDGKWRNNYINKLIQFDNEKTISNNVNIIYWMFEHFPNIQ